MGADVLTVLSVIAAVADGAAWLERHAVLVALAACAVWVMVLVVREWPITYGADPDPEPADFDAHPDAAELGALFADVLAEYGVTAETSDDPGAER